MKWSAILFYLFTVRTYLENRVAVNDGAATERSYMEVSTRYANGFLNEYGQDLHKEEKTEYDFASELKNKMQNQKKKRLIRENCITGRYRMHQRILKRLKMSRHRMLR